jgi:hypothetical protein
VTDDLHEVIQVLRASPSGTRLGRSQALTTYFLFLELRHKAEIHRMTGRVIECPTDEMIRPRGAKDAASDSAVRAGGQGAVRWPRRAAPPFRPGRRRRPSARQGRVMVQQGDPLVEREPLQQVVDALHLRESGIAERRPVGVG